MRYNITKKFLMFWCLFIGISAVFGSVMMFISPSGKLLQMDNLIIYFEVLPFSNILFQDYIFSGISLLIVNGITNLLAFYFLITNKKLGIILGSIFGISLMLWIIIQFIILPFNMLSTIFFIIGFIQFITGYMTYVFYNQEKFIFDETLYKNINKNKDILVVYFSRMGYTKKIAYENANKNKGYILEITTNEHTKGTSGFLWCGRYGMLKRGMPINNININLKEYKKVIIVSPIWVFDISSPIREFIIRYKNDINSVEYVVTHYMKSKFINVKDELDKMLNKKCDKFTSICIRLGKVIKEYEIMI